MPVSPSIAAALPAPSQRPLYRLVENRTTFGGHDVELAIYDTLRPAERVALKADHPLYCGMVTGVKHIHTAQGEVFPFVPQESLVLAPGEEIWIDFPGASDDAPTTCLTVGVEEDKVRDLVARFNSTMPRHDGAWSVPDARVAHFGNTASVEQLLATLTRLFTENPPFRDALIDLNVSELLLRMLQTQARALLLGQTALLATQNSLAAAVQYVRDNLHRPIEVAEVAGAACMSVSSLYRYFRNELGMTPLAFIHREQMQEARRQLTDVQRSVTEVSFALGFRSVSHFIRLFQRHIGTTPKQYQLGLVRPSGPDARA
ncbi:MAG: helix-turn-helix domain-containing protein [Bacteroidota bacterium]